MKKYIITKSNYREFNKIGGKIKGLCELTEKGFNVPEWFAVSSDFFYENLEQNQKKELDTEKKLLELIDNFSIENYNFLDDAVNELGKSTYFAVRSSAIDEDSSDFSFAGQLDSFLYVKKEEIFDYIKMVWRSAYSDHILEYRKRNNISKTLEIPCVIVQNMISSETAGVVFSKNPVNGENNIVINAAFGLGSSLVNGEVSGDTYVVDLEENKIIDIMTGEKEIQHVLDSSENKGIKIEKLEEEKKTKQVLDENMIFKISLIAEKIEKEFGLPQDIEWAEENKKIYILQARPITTLSKINKNKREIIWDNSNIVESYSDITLPLTFSFVRSVYSKVYEQFSTIMGVDKITIRNYMSVFDCMLGYLNSRVYYNLLNWYKLLTLFPGFKSNKKFMEQMMGVKEELPIEIQKSITEEIGLEKFVNKLKLVRTFFGFGINFLLINRNVKKFQKLLNETLDDRNLDDMQEIDLFNYYTELENKLLYNWETPIMNDFYTMITFGILKNIIKKYNLDNANGTLHNELIIHEAKIISVEPSKYIEKMGGIIRQDTSIMEKIKINTEKSELENILFENKEFKKIYDEYLKKFGDRSIAELKLESPTLYENSEILLRTVIQVAENNKEKVTENIEESKIKEEEALKKLNGKFLKKYIFKKSLKLARKHVELRENLRYERTRVFGKVRKIFIKFGEIFEKEGILLDKKDIFFVDKDEVFSLVNGVSTYPNLKNIVKLRKIKLAEDREKEVLPDRLKTYGVIDENFHFISLDKKEVSDSNIRKGIGCCKGVIRGEVQIVRNPNDTKIKKNSIIVAHSTDPGWVMVFPLAKGLIVEKGSLLSHSAIVARELGLPAVVAVDRATKWLKDGDMVELDGSTGVIVKLEG